MVEAYIKTEKGVWLCAAVVKSGRDMREWGRPMRRQSYAKGCFHHIKGIIYSAQAAEFLVRVEGLGCVVWCVGIWWHRGWMCNNVKYRGKI
ncbi:hypothetical protein ACSQ67_006844 [Phaseolus vulgaris]